jgi:hypothetical protein
MGVLGYRSCRRGREADNWSTKKAAGERARSSDVKRTMWRSRCIWRAMAHRMLNREKMEGGIRVLPLTRTSRVPSNSG